MYKVRNPFSLFYWVLGLLFFAAAAVILFRYLYPLDFTESIEKHAAPNNLDPPFVAAVIKTESNFDRDALSNKDARGLMQITPQTGRWIAGRMGLKDYKDELLNDPDYNIMLGCWYIQYLHDYYHGDRTLAMAAYNGGSGNVDKWLKDTALSSNGITLERIPFRETKDFVKRVQNNYKAYKIRYKWEQSSLWKKLRDGLF